MPKNDFQTKATTHEAKLRALCALSDIDVKQGAPFFMSFVKDAPDPETAVQGVINRLSQPSAALHRKWRSLITDLWTFNHPHVPALPQWPLSAEDVAIAPLLLDAREVLTVLEEKSAVIVQEKNEWLISPDDAMRLAQSMPSQTGQPLFAVENEWNCLDLKRLRSVLQAARLVRAIKGHLVPVRSRLDRWRSLPAAQQLYVLWHADVYHVHWQDYAGLWSKYMKTIQDYLPLLWEANENVDSQEVEDRTLWAIRILETFLPLWEEEGLLDLPRGHRAALQIVQQHALPTIIDRFLLRDLLERHGLITITEEFGSISKFTWTSAGAKIIAAETNRDLTCGNNLLETW
ncbi:MAG: hypothetical protein Q8P73_03830 [bacterium]|nr:hypothetical protein [bacterium]MDZ4343533.1 hypothetical protein [Candidatus Binatia bacterium]